MQISYTIASINGQLLSHLLNPPDDSKGNYFYSRSNSDQTDTALFSESKTATTDVSKSDERKKVIIITTS